MTGFFVMENLNKDKLKRRAEYTEILIKIINNTDIKFYRDKDIPKTENGITNKAKQLLEKYRSKLKEEGIFVSENDERKEKLNKLTND